MSEKGIMFTTPMILAITRDKVKTHTRRVEASLREVNKNPDNWIVTPTLDKDTWAFVNFDKSERINSKPRYKVGDVLYLKETHKVSTPPNKNIAVYYKADKIVRFLNPFTYEYSSEISNGDELFENFKYKSAMFMKKVYARYSRYKVLSVIPKRAHDMTDKDAIEEGVEVWFENLKDRQFDYYSELICRAAKIRDPKALVTNRVDKYAVLWDIINGKKKGSTWKDNIWVFDYQFEEIKF